MKEVEVKLLDDSIIAIVSLDAIKIKDVGDNYTIVRLKPSDIEDISHALKTLNK